MCRTFTTASGPTTWTTNTTNRLADKKPSPADERRRPVAARILSSLPNKHRDDPIAILLLSQNPADGAAVKRLLFTAECKLGPCCHHGSAPWEIHTHP